MGSCGVLWDGKTWGFCGGRALVGDLLDTYLKTVSWWVLVWGGSIWRGVVENYVGNVQNFLRKVDVKRISGTTKYAQDK